MTTFQQFLDEKYYGIDNDSNNMNEVFEARRDKWFKNLDIQEIINFGEEYGAYTAYETASDIGDKIAIQTITLHDKLKKLNETE